MARESFSSKLKEQLSEEEIKKKCCQHTFACVISLRDGIRDSDASETLREIYDKCRCDSCKSAFVRAVFILFGSVTDPGKSYHLEFSSNYEAEINVIMSILEGLEFNFHKTVRYAKYIIYTKDSSILEDFLVFIGAQTAAFEVMNIKIEREFRNSVNRQVNCDTANIEKQLASTRKYTEAIQYLISSGSIEKLSPELKQTALLRLENEQLTLTDLGKIVTPPVSKSGIKHRLEKILEFANNESGETRFSE